MASNKDTLKKIIETGLGMAFLTEESVREFVGDIKLPGEAKKYLVSQAKKRKSDLVDVISSEIKNFLGKINVHEELQKALAGLKIDVSATINIESLGKGVKVTKSRVTRKKK